VPVFKEVSKIIIIIIIIELMTGDKARVKLTSSSTSPTSSPAAAAAGSRVALSDSSAVTKRWIQSTSLQPMKPVNRRSDDVTVTSRHESSSSRSSVPAVNVRHTIAIFESYQ